MYYVRNLSFPSIMRPKHFGMSKVILYSYASSQQNLNKPNH